MNFTWDDAKRKSNLRQHGIDFAEAERAFSGPTFSFEDDRITYGERRLVTLAFLQGVPVSIVHTETDDEIHIISFRKATKRETEILIRNLQDGLDSPEDDER